tara:strand:- start:812 stop:1621 length:810 start_codon:yes stop_codon:yes gene_type:complete
MSKMLKISNLCFSWGENQVLKDINLNVNSNELIAILGVNGAGKSTLIKCINGILKPNSGNINILESEIGEMDLLEVAKIVSYVPQNVQTNFPMDVFDVVLLGRRPHINWKISQEDRDKVSTTLRMLSLEDFAFRRFDKLSGGEKQRVVIAKAIAQDPNLYLFDEPTSDLDLWHQIEVMEEIKKLISDKDSGKSAIIAIHDINMAIRYADKIMLLHNGSIEYFGKPEEVITNENIEHVFGVSCDINPAIDDSPMRIYVKDKTFSFKEEEE